MVADWIINMISHSKIELNWGNTKINRKTKKWCPQGGVLSPFLWNLVLDNLIQKFNNSDNIQAFADDLSLLSIGKTQNGIINNTKISVQWKQKWYTNNHPKHIQIDEQRIEISKSVKYLGVMIDN